MRVSFAGLPDHARLWIFGVEAELSGQDEAEFLARVDAFLDAWAAHGASLTCGRDWVRNRFLMVAVDEGVEEPSGCSIDAFVSMLRDAQGALGTRIVDNAAVWYLEGSSVRRATRAEFRALAESGAVTPETTVFDNTIIRLQDLRAGRWERPARDAWHARAFFRTAEPVS